jgi:DsbC/DsbD-like thiol-disulfide interchange protein
LASGFNVPVDLSQFAHAEVEAADIHVSAFLAATDIKFMQHADLIVRLALADGLHVYGQPVPDGYFATEVVVTGPEGLRVGTPRYPSTKPFKVEGLHEEFQVFEGNIEIVVPLIWASREGESLPIDVEVRYQACDERQCFLPATQRLHLEAPIGQSVAVQRQG